MAEATITYAGTMNVYRCAACGVPYALDAEYERRRRIDQKPFYCPNGHHLSFGGRTEAERERDEARARAERFERELGDMRAALPADHKAAARRAQRWSDNRALLGAFWAGFNARECGRCLNTCPYQTERGGFRRAWLEGWGDES